MITVRQQRILKLIDVERQSGMEIGPLAFPIVSPDMGDIVYTDHATTDELRAKYADDKNVDVSQIMEINHVWGQQTLREAVGSDQSFDYVVASHVIEHVPDMVTWFDEIFEILRPGGVLALAIPDKRFTFDITRPCTTTAELIGAHLNRLRKPSPRQIYGHFSAVVHTDTAKVWAAGNNSEGFELTENRKPAYDLARRAVESGDYVDSHCWVLTPYTFIECYRELVELGLISFEIADFLPTGINELEFYASLRRPLETLPAEAAKRRILDSCPELSEPDVRNGIEFFAPAAQPVAADKPEPGSDTYPSWLARLIACLRRSG